MPAPTVLVATRSEHKLREIREILSDLPVRFASPSDLDLDPLPAEADLEPFDTFADNALSKARHFHARAGVPTIADDSGLCVDALDGGPGVRTKRFAPEPWAERWGRDEANNRWLLAELDGVPPSARGAHYRCAIGAVREGSEAVFEGRVQGRIAREPRGEGGFGYDPLFMIPEKGRTYAELPPSVKLQTSHRADALRKLRPWLGRLVEAASS